MPLASSSVVGIPNQGGMGLTNLIDNSNGSTLPFSNEPPKWVPNERSENCQACNKNFSIFRRKHHCRSCGVLVCHACSPDMDFVQGYKDRRVRVCKTCFNQKKKRIREINQYKAFNSLYNFKNVNGSNNSYR